MQAASKIAEAYFWELAIRSSSRQGDCQLARLRSQPMTFHRTPLDLIHTLLAASRETAFGACNETPASQ